MKQLAATINKKLDALTESYADRLAESEAYAHLSAEARQNTARQILQLVKTGLEKGDNEEFLQYIRSGADGAALSALEESLMPLVTRAKPAKFLWRTLSEARQISADGRSMPAEVAEELRLARYSVEHADYAVFWIDPQARFYYVNETTCQNLGYSREELLSMTVFDVDPAFPPEAWPAHWQELKQKGSLAIETEHQTKEGRKFPVEVTLTYAEFGGNEYNFAFARDITQRQKNREALQRTQFAVDHAAYSIFWINEEAEFDYVNETTCRKLGYSQEELLSMDIFDMDPAFPPEAWPAHWQELKQKGSITIETQHQAKDGRLIPVEVNLNYMQFGDKAYNVAFAHDISKRKEAEQERRRLSSILEATSDLVSLSDPQGRLIYINRAGREMLGLPEDIAISDMEIPDIHPPWAMELINQQGVPTAIAEGRWSGETAINGPDGREIPVLQVIMGHTSPEGELEYLSTIMRDISERKRFEEQLQESLERRKREVETSTEVAQEIAAVPVLEELFRQVVELVQSRFGYYHVHIYTLEDDDLVMQEGTGEAGRRMKEAGHQIPYTAEKSLVARAARSGKAVLVPDVSQEAGWLPNPLLPDTKAEIAVPIKLSEQTLGVLDVQNNIVGSLGSEDQILLTGLCGQIASAMESTRLLEEANIFQQFAEASGQGIGWTTMEGEVVYANPALAEMLEEDSPDQMIGQPIIQYYGPEIQHLPQEEIIPAVMSTGQWIGELPLTARSGKKVPAINNMFLIRDQAGNPRYVANLVTDISERKQIEAEMAENLRELQAMQRAMSREGWERFPETVQLPGGYLFDRGDLQPADDLWVEEMAEAAGQKSLVAPDGQETDEPEAAVAPMLVQDEIIGLLGIYDDDPDRPLSADELALIEAISEQAALALESARLFQQTQAALTETEMLYNLSGALGAANNFEEVLMATITPAMAAGAEGANLYTIETNEEGEPEWITTTATWRAEGDPRWPPGTRFNVSELPFTSLWFSSPDDPILVDDIQILVDNIQIDEQIPTEMEDQARTQGLAILPLTLGERWVGLATIHWPDSQTFTDKDQRLYRSITTQAAVVFNNLLLLEQTQTRAELLARLAEIEAALAQAQHEEEILEAIALSLTEEPGVQINLSYIETDEQNQPLTMTTVASRRDGKNWSDNPAYRRLMTLAESPFPHLWIEQPDTATLIEDTETDERVEPSFRQFLHQFEIEALAMLPLHSGGRWHGLVVIGWQTAHEFSDMEQFIFQQLIETLSVTVAGRRASLAQQETLAETQNLYRTANAINQAASMVEALVAFAEGLSIQAIDRAWLVELERDPLDNVAAITVRANWRSDPTAVPATMNRRYDHRQLPDIDLVLTTEPIFIESVQEDERIGSITEETLKATSLAILPLGMGKRQFGALLLLGQQPHEFTDQEKRLCASLAQQVAITVENQRLLKETQTALAEVEATQRRYTLQAWQEYQSRQITTHYEQTTSDAVPLPDTPPPATQEVIQQRQTITDEANLVVPLAVRGEVIGVLGLQELAAKREWTAEEIALIETIGAQMAQAAENIRLLDVSQQRAARERRLNEINEKIQAAQSLEEALQVAVREVGLSLQSPQTRIELKVKQDGKE